MCDYASTPFFLLLVVTRRCLCIIIYKNFHIHIFVSELIVDFRISIPTNYIHNIFNYGYRKFLFNFITTGKTFNRY